MKKAFALGLSYGCFQNYISLVFEDKQTHRDRLKCLVSIQESVQQGGGQSSIQRLTGPTDPITISPLYNKKNTEQGTFIGYLWADEENQ